MNLARPPVRVAVLAFPEASASVVYGMYDLFAGAGRDWGFVVDGTTGPQLMRPVVVSSRTGTFRAVNGVPITPEAGLEACATAALVCVPEVTVSPGERLAGRFAQEVECLAQAYARGATLATACSGALLLAEAGLLDGREATIHWAYGDALRRNHPRVKVRDARALVVSGEGGRLVMAGGGTSWLDLALYLIARLVGVEAAMQVARLNLIDWHEVGQQPFAHLARSRQVEDAVIGRCQIWIADNYREPAPVTSMAKLSGLPERTFSRRFRLATGMPPLEYVHALRLEEAKQMLETTGDAIEDIAHEVGYEDAGYFSRLFRREVNLTPAQYRRRFRGLRQRLERLP